MYMCICIYIYIYIHTYIINHTQMDVLPAHLNRDSFRDSFKGLVTLEIIIDLPIGFPINNIISLLFGMNMFAKKKLHEYEHTHMNRH